MTSFLQRIVQALRLPDEEQRMTERYIAAQIAAEEMREEVIGAISKHRRREAIAEEAMKQLKAGLVEEQKRLMPPVVDETPQNSSS